MPKISIVIPAYNEEKTLGTVLQKVTDLKLPTYTKEIIVVDDGSADKTHKIAQDYAKDHKSVIVLKHEKNQGKGAAVVTGFEKASGDIILIQDADLEYDPKDIPMLLEPIENGKAKVVYGTRLKMKPVFFGKNRTPFLFHFFGNKFLSLTTSALYHSEITDMETGYKVFTNDSLKGIKLKAKSFDFEPEITAKILKKGIKILELEIATNPRGYDEGKKINPVTDGVAAVWTLVKYRFVD